MIIFSVIDGSSTDMPILAKNMGDSSIYDSVSKREAIYVVLCVFEMTSPARKAPVMSATPKKALGRVGDEKTERKGDDIEAAQILIQLINPVLKNK